MNTQLTEIEKVFLNLYKTDNQFKELIDDLRTSFKDMQYFKGTGQLVRYFDANHDYNLYFKTACLNVTLQFEAESEIENLDVNALMMIVRKYAVSLTPVLE